MAAAAILPYLPMIASGVGEIIKGVGTTKAAERQAELLRGLSAEGKAEIPGLEKRMDQYGIGPSMRKLRQIAAEDPIGDLARQNLERRQATSIGALKAGGAKSLFALPATMTSMGDARRKIDADAFGRMRQALTTVGQAEERVGARKYMQDAADLGTARSQALGYELDAAAAEQARRDAITGMVTGGLSTLGSLAASGAFGDGSGGAPKEDIPLNRGGRTKGSFNHDTNDMEIVDKNGKSTGMSVTGDEVVLNPKQQEAIAKQSSYFRSLMKTPRFR